MSWKQIVGELAPTIGTALGGPLGGMAANIVCEALGIDKASSDDQITQQLMASPDNLLKLKQAELEFKEHMAQNNVDLEKINAADRDSARQREVQTKDITPRLLAGLIVCGYIAVQYFLLTHIIDTGMREIIMRTLGTIDGALIMVLSYYFGSSSGSDKKSDIIAGISK